MRLIDADALPVHRVKILHAFGIYDGNVVFPEHIANATTIYPVQQWISVKDRLPEDDRDYLLFIKRGDFDVGYFRSGFWTSYAEISPEVTHWMPLPEPPKEE